MNHIHISMGQESPEIAVSAIITNSRFGRYCSVGANTRFCYSSLGDFSYVSVNSNVFSTNIGKFSSISWNVSINPAKHDYRRFTQHPILFAKKYGMLPPPPPMQHPYYKQYSETNIGNDVWIGCNAVVLGGVKIGDGAIIGCGATISHDVPPYAIIVGRNMHLKNRFPEQIIEKLLDLKWWDYPIDKIKLLAPLLAKEPTLELITKIREVGSQSESAL